MPDSALARLLAERVGSSFEFAGYEVSRAENASEEAEAFELRHRVFVEEGFLESGRFPDGLFTDQFDAESTHILVRDSSEALVATTRFVHPSALGLPTEYLFDFTPPNLDRSRVGEYGRLAIDATHRGGTRAPMLAMLKGVFECMIETKITHVFAFLSPALAKSYAALGCISIPLETKPPSKTSLRNREPMSGYFKNQNAIPVLFNLFDMMVEVGVPFDRGEFSFVNDAIEISGSPELRLLRSPAGD
jgi:N-acyl-L-homoserine lactone synthetase